MYWPESQRLSKTTWTWEGEHRTPGKSSEPSHPDCWPPWKSEATGPFRVCLEQKLLLGYHSQRLMRFGKSLIVTDSKDGFSRLWLNFTVDYNQKAHKSRRIILGKGQSSLSYYHRQKKRPPPATTWTSVRCGCLPQLGISQPPVWFQAKVGNRNAPMSRWLRGGGRFFSVYDSTGKWGISTEKCVRFMGNQL